jgi:protein gp37
MAETSIEWTMGDDGTPGKTWNPTDGCQVCSPGCANCYAMRFAGRFSKPGERYHGLVSIGKNKRAIWTGVGRLDRGKLAKPLSWKKPRRIFVNSMSDLFFDAFTNEEIAAVFGVMAACPQHTFMILTKRAKRMREWFAWLDDRVETDAEEWSGRDCAMSIDAARDACRLEYLDDTACAELSGNQDVCHLGLTTAEGIRWPLKNVWLGTSVENQDAADERIPDLLGTPAAVRFLSCEPLLGEVKLDNVRTAGGLVGIDALRGLGARHVTPRPRLSGRIDWVVSGCESGPGARHCDVAWLRSLRDQCFSAGVPFFLKQARADELGHAYGSPLPVTTGPGSKRKAGGIIGLPYLDGVQHGNFPKAAP